MPSDYAEALSNESTHTMRVHRRLAHDSAAKHVSGEAVYVDDMLEPAGLLHAQIGMSTKAHAALKGLDLEVLRKAAGVRVVLTADDIPGHNDFGHAAREDDRVFAQDVVEYAGQSMFCVVADTYEHARKAAKLDVADYVDRTAILQMDDAISQKSLICPPRRIERGNASTALERAPHRIQGRLSCGGQEHFYLEPQASMAVPKEDGDIHIYCATQDPSAVQHIVARILGKPANSVTVEVRRMGGAFGGKETLATHYAAVAALASLKTGRPVKCRLDRDDDMILTGKRHAFQFDYDVGFDDKGKILGITFQVGAQCGYSEDQSIAILDRAIYHCDGAYYLPNVTITGYACKTNTCTGCAFRGFGSPQALLGIERVLDEIAYALDLDPLSVRKYNLYGMETNNVTHYDWTIKDNILPRILEEIEDSSNYVERRKAVRDFNAKNSIIKKGIALLPLKYGVGFTAAFLNQAGALVHIYQDGSIHLNHGGTEMGQGLYIKVAQIVAEEFQVGLDTIKVSSTVTDKVPNTTATAASSGTDMNGAAAQIAAQTLKKRLVKFAANYYKVEPKQIVFEDGNVHVGTRVLSFPELVHDAYMNLVQLSASGFYKNPKIDVDADTMKGRPYHYNVYGSAVVEVAIDTLTGESKVLRIDIVHDVGRSINPAVDRGQLEGGFVQGIGWLTSEELWWDNKGHLRTHAPSTYKIPVASDRPQDFRMHLVDWSHNLEDTVYRSKAIGEPPFNLAVSTFLAITDAVASVADYKICPRLDAPATPERILTACDELRERDCTNLGYEACESVVGMD